LAERGRQQIPKKVRARREILAQDIHAKGASMGRKRRGTIEGKENTYRGLSLRLKEIPGG